MSGTERGYSTTDDDAFWCCVGSGMESHAKHGDSIFWEGEDGTFYVNLYIPATVDWAKRKAGVTLDTSYPYGTTSTLRSEEHTSELQSLMRISYAVFCLNKKKMKRTKETR